jgi:hypothetical protein
MAFAYGSRESITRTRTSAQKRQNLNFYKLLTPREILQVFMGRTSTIRPINPRPWKMGIGIPARRLWARLS